MAKTMAEDMDSISVPLFTDAGMRVLSGIAMRGSITIED